MNDLLSDRRKVLRAGHTVQSPAVVIPAAGPESVDTYHPTAMEIEL